ncbi:hypothetical protein C1H46_012509 [Malus baccata]|uniref:Uncharacterized protein n=1 Tax=Malus baccata TaxID=106549 RepID=A0A540MSV5_MALBA|nr:hypothetical protein C1H46_012509 [Malus baccata]
MNPMIYCNTNCNINKWHTGFAMKKKPEAPIRPWKLPVHALELLSLYTEIAYRGGATRKAIQPAKYVFSYTICFLRSDACTYASWIGTWMDFDLTMHVVVEEKHMLKEEGE